MDRKAVAADTVAISKNGQYKLGGRVVQIKNEKNSEFWKLDDAGVGYDLVTGEKEALVSLRRESTVDTIWNLHGQGVDGGKVGVLNFASAYYPGGGFLNGAMAQEEALAYCSDLYFQIEGNEFYDINSKFKSKMYTDSAIWSRVTFFKDSQFRLTQNVYAVNVLTCPAVNMGQVQKNGENVEKARQVMFNRMERVLRLFVQKYCGTVVLGAWGCGVFGNDPVEIAENWRKLLVDENYVGCFKNVIFSVLDKNASSPTFKAFDKMVNAM